MIVYVITNSINGKQYVGIATDAERRWREHFSGHGSRLVYQAIRKYGRDNLRCEVWYEDKDVDWIRLMERRAIVMLRTKAPGGYNLTLGGEGTQGWKPTADTLVRMSKAHAGKRNAMAGKKHSVETREKMATKARARVITAERRDHLRSLSGVGAANPNAKPIVLNGVRYGCSRDASQALGVSMSTIAKLRRSGETVCERFDRVEHGRKWGELSRGRKLSTEVRNRMGKARQGANHPRARPVVLGGVKYGCLKEAAADRGINYSTLRWRFQTWSRSGKFPVGFGYCDTFTH